MLRDGFCDVCHKSHTLGRRNRGSYCSRRCCDNATALRSFYAYVRRSVRLRPTEAIRPMRVAVRDWLPDPWYERSSA